MLKKIAIFGLILFGLLGGIFYCGKNFKGNEVAKTVTVNVFIHGTRLSGFNFLSAKPIIKHEPVKEHSFYEHVVESSRNDVRFYDSQIMLEKGLVLVPQEILEKCRQLKLAPGESRRAAIQVLNGYDMLLSKNDEKQLYYTFGWDGILSDKEREQESRILYDALIDLRDQLLKQFPESTIKFILHGHSHGGNLILYLALHENMQKKNLVVDKAILYGTPIQPETACFCQHALFKKIINIFSEGDKVQVADIFSTSSKCSKRRFADVLSSSVVKQEKRIVELCVSAAGSRRAFSHASFYFLGLHGIGIIRSVERVFKIIKPLPVVLFAPIFLDMLDKSDIQDGSLNFVRYTPNDCRLVISSVQQSIESENLVPLISQIKEVIEKSWKPYALYGYAHLGGLALADLFTAIPQYTKYKDLKYKARRAARKISRVLTINKESEI